MTLPISFVVPGRAQPAGSKRAFPFRRKNGKLGATVTDTNPEAAGWKQLVALSAPTGVFLCGPLELIVAIRFVRPAGHFLKGGALCQLGRSRPYPSTRPDATKLVRAIEDALNGILWRDDGQIVRQHVSKAWGLANSVTITVRELQGPVVPDGVSRAASLRDGEVAPSSRPGTSTP